MEEVTALKEIKSALEVQSVELQVNSSTTTLFLPILIFMMTGKAAQHASAAWKCLVLAALNTIHAESFSAMQLVSPRIPSQFPPLNFGLAKSHPCRPALTQTLARRCTFRHLQ